MALSEKLQQLRDDLAVVDDPQERLTLILDRSKKHQSLTADEKIDSHRVRGCVSVVWLVGEVSSGVCVFRCDADSPLVRGLVALLCDFFSGAPASEIATCSVDPLADTGVLRNLSPTRRNGLESARQTIITFARSQISARPEHAN